MSDDPIRLRDGNDPELAELRKALREAGDQGPDAAWHERMAEKVDDALRDGDVEPPESSVDDPPDRERPSVEPPQHTEVTVESQPGEIVPELVEAEVGAGLTAGLLAAGAAMAWLRRRSTRPPLEGDDKDDDGDEDD